MEKLDKFSLVDRLNSLGRLHESDSNGSINVVVSTPEGEYQVTNAYWDTANQRIAIVGLNPLSSQI